MAHLDRLFFGLIGFSLGLFGLITKKTPARNSNMLTKEKNPIGFWFQTIFSLAIGIVLLVEAFLRN
jgi:hypothetical protein